MTDTAAWDLRRRLELRQRLDPGPLPLDGNKRERVVETRTAVMNGTAPRCRNRYVTVHIPDETMRILLALVARQELQTGQPVNLSEWIRKAVEQRVTRELESSP